MNAAAPLTVAYCLLTYRPDHPSGIERSIAAQIAGMRQLGHTAFVIAGGPPEPGDAAEPGLIRLESVRLPRPALAADVLAALADEQAVTAEVRQILIRHRVDVACWGATVWGLGHLGAAPPGVATALMVHNTIRPGSDLEPWRRAFAAADVVCPASGYLLDAAAAGGWDTSNWTVVPNALLTDNVPVPAYEQREQLRRNGPIRIVSRAEPGKGQAHFLAAMPKGWDRPVEVVLAEADFEFSRGSQQEAIAAVRDQARRRPGLISVLPALPWRQVPPFFAGAAVTAITSLEPETFSHTAAEALSTGTPVLTFDLGYVPTLVGPAGAAVPLEAGFPALWDALASLLDDHDAYHAASRAAPARTDLHTPVNAASALLAATVPARV